MENTQIKNISQLLHLKKKSYLADFNKKFSQVFRVDKINKKIKDGSIWPYLLKVRNLSKSIKVQRSGIDTIKYHT